MLMLAAVEAFEAEYAGETVRISLGEWVIEGHELHRRYPGRFGKTTVGRSPSHSSRPTVARSARRAWPAASLEPSRRAWPATSPDDTGVTVFLTESARRSIVWDIGHMDGDFRECGGALIGRTTGPGRLTIEVAGQTNDHIGRSATHIETNSSGYRDLARQYSDLGYRWLGDWHSHPSETRAKPSTADLECWTGCRNHLGADYVGIIALVPERGDPPLRAWVATAAGVERVSLIEA